MLKISRWTPQGGSYRTIQRFFNKIIPWTTLCWLFFRMHRRSYPMVMEQIVRSDTSSAPATSAPKQQDDTQTASQQKRGRPKGSRNRNKDDVVLTDILKQLQTMVMSLLPKLSDLTPLRYMVLDGYFGHNNALQMVKQCGLHLISKLRTDAALYFPPTTPYGGRDAHASTATIGNLRTEVYQMELRHKKFADPLSVVCVLKTNLTTQQQSHVLLFSSDVALDAEKMIDYYSLRFQIEFNFRDAKQYWDYKVLLMSTRYR